MKYFYCLLSFFIAIIILTFSHTSTFSAELPEGMNEFIHGYLAAAKQKDPEAIIKLSHQASRECSLKGDKEFYDQLVQQQIVKFGSNDNVLKIMYQQLSAENLKKMGKSLEKRKMKWPVNPEGRIIILYASFHKTSKAAFFVARDSQGWKWVHVCRKESQDDSQPVVFGNEFLKFDSNAKKSS